MPLNNDNFGKKKWNRILTALQNARGRGEGVTKAYEEKAFENMGIITEKSCHLVFLKQVEGQGEGSLKDLLTMFLLHEWV